MDLDVVPPNLIENHVIPEVPAKKWGLMIMTCRRMQTPCRAAIVTWARRFGLAQREGEHLGHLLYAVIVQMGRRPVPSKADDGEEYQLMTFGTGEDGKLGTGVRQCPLPTRVPGIEGSVRSVSAGPWHMLVVTHDGRLWGCGSTRQGQLGPAYPEDTRGARHHVAPIKMPDCFAIAASAGCRHSVVVTNEESGNVYAFGSNCKGQLGLGAESDDSVSAVSKVTAMENTQVCQAVAGWMHTLFLTSDGNVFGAGDNTSVQITGRTWRFKHRNKNPIPIPIDLWRFGNDRRAVLIAAEQDISAFVTSTGYLCLLGSAVESYLKMPGCSLVDGVAKIDLGCDQRIVDVSIGCRHVMLRTLGGKVMCFGRNTHGQLGCKPSSLSNGVYDIVCDVSPLPADHLYLSACNNQSAIFTNSGVCTFGCNDLGQLDPFLSKARPVLEMTSLCGFEIADVSMGFSHTAVVVRKRDEGEPGWVAEDGRGVGGTCYK